jgi:Dyp-type peroxidase family
MLQEGIFHEPGTAPPANFGIMFLKVSEGADASAVGRVLEALWRLYGELKQGRMPGLPGITVDPGHLNVLLGYGPKAFALPEAQRPLPEGLGPRNQFRSVAMGGGNPLLRGAGLSYETGLLKNFATEEIAVQFLGDTPLAIHRPMVESWKLFRATTDPLTRTPLLQITAFFSGFHREDRRSWIDFHDGLSNPPKGERRRAVIIIKEDDTSREDAWTRGGTYLTFMRLPIDLEFWQQRSRREQELLVGRDKVTGCAFDRTMPEALQPVAGCPFHGTLEVSHDGNEVFREPPDGVDEVLKRSHVQRANHHRQDFANPESLRIYRQGYEFAESVQNGQPRVGLNFVSFHDTPFRVIEMLTRPDWLGGVNFGGELSVAATLIRVAAAGIYLIPPVNPGAAFPGAEIFQSEAAPAAMPAAAPLRARASRLRRTRRRER